MDRRSFLATTALLGGLAGCTGAGTGGPLGDAFGSSTQRQTPSATATETPPEPPSCTDPGRPEPERGSDGVEPMSYPATRPDLEESEAMGDYITAYERAYRTNSLLEEYGTDLTYVTVVEGNPRFFDSSSASVIGRLEYFYVFETTEDRTRSPTVYASYYIDDSVVVRTWSRGYIGDESELDPDPREVGDVLECFE